ncbi:cohesin domain-containing protein [Pseudoalteromonas umbrosa]|uniref:cohesin domain-containing protein n=1 Tax=Pseudoalteromonas umbrosa TaxID=3048489 RepID=UPI0024C290E9|nr:cohesin domain-containing protein [Pseudoalteromonas sp. B95]MDK1286744.1 cohesin domain-containing protein [Pseudoalteromonas sp. B95]
MKLLIMSLFLLNSLITAASQGKAYLYTPEKNIKMGSHFYVDIMIKEAPDVYGTQIFLQFDANQISVLDKNDKEAGIQIEHGDFFDSARLYTLQNSTNMKEGSINYIVSQIAPSDSRSGDGRIARVYFKANDATSEASIQLAKADFGTKQGEKFVFSLGKPLQFKFDEAYIEGPQAPQDYTTTLILFGVVGMAFILVILSLFKLRRQKQLVNA